MIKKIPLNSKFSCLTSVLIILLSSIFCYQIDIEEITPSPSPSKTDSPTPDTPPTETLVPTPDINARLLESVNNLLRPGVMSFNPPEKMRQADEVKIEVRIEPIGQAGENPSPVRLTAAATEITSNLEGPGTPVVELITVGTVMKARLAGDGFEIQALSEEEQFVADDTYTEWVWLVKPIKTGEQQLNLTVTVKVFSEGLGERARDIPVISKTVEVEIDPMHTITTFIHGNWQWLAASLLLPFVGWGWGVYKKNKEAQIKKREKSHRNRQFFE